jgi:hypothetical protein
MNRGGSSRAGTEPSLGSPPARHANIRSVSAAHFAVTVPDDPQLLARLEAAITRQSDPPISAGRSATAVLAFQAETGETMLRSRVIQALEEAVGPDWQALVQPLA